MVEKVVIADRTLFTLNSISYKRMEEKDVTVDRPLCFGFLRKNGGHGCHTGQDLRIVYGRGTTRVGFMLLKLGTCYFGMFGVGFLMSIPSTRYPKDAY